jgi:hypothetical protein
MDARSALHLSLPSSSFASLTPVRQQTVMVGRGEGTHLGKSAGRGMRGTYHRRALRKRAFEGRYGVGIRRVGAAGKWRGAWC